MMKIFFLVLLFLWNDKEGADAVQECGSVVNNTLKSPGYPNNYPSNMYCTYTISIPHNMTFINFIDFELEDGYLSCSDYLEIVDRLYCGQRTGLSIPLTEGQVLIYFRTGRMIEKRGFLIYINIDPNGMSFDQVWKSTWISQNYQWCGQVNNTIISPGYPNDYSNNTDCIFSVPIPQGMVINITINELLLEDSASCDRDYLQITNENRVFGKYCGHMTGKTVFVSGKYALITFHSGSKIQNRGFLIKFSVVVPPSVPEPAAFYPLNARYKTAEKDNRLLKGILGNVVLTNGPYNEPGGAYEFYGTRSSYIEFRNIGAQDTWLSITLMCWVNVQQLEGDQYFGPLFAYVDIYDHMHISIVGMSIWSGRLFIRIDPRLPNTSTVEVLPVGKWVHVAGSYDYTTGNCSLYINGHLSISQNIGTGHKIETSAHTFRMGSILWETYFKGKIAELKIYDVALNEAQIQTSIRRVLPMVTFPAAVLAIQGGMLSCSARGTTPIYTALIWNSTVLVNTTNTATIRLDKDGNYTCQATNQYGTNVKELQVNFTTFDPDIGFLISEGYPCCYPRNTTKSSIYPIPKGFSINIYFQDFYVEKSEECTKDFLKIIDGMGKVSKYCGNKTGQNVNVTGDKVEIRFSSNDKTEERGYVLKFTLDSLASDSRAVPEPVAFYPLNSHYEAAEKENRQLEGILGDVSITNGPYNEPGGAYMFYGTVQSFIEFPNRGGLDTRFSITLMCWVQPSGGQYSGPLFSYGDSRNYLDDVVGMWIVEGHLSIIIAERYSESRHKIKTSKVLPVGKWVHVAANYDHSTGNSSLYFNGHLSISQYIGKGYEVDTTAQKVRMGAVAGEEHYSFKGKIAEMKVYDVALNETQIQTSIRQVPPMVTFPAAVLAIQGGMLSCSARGTPPIYTALIWNSTVLVNTTNTTATIRLDKDGSYTCQATNQNGTDVKELQVNFTTFDPDIGFLISEGYPYSYPRNTKKSSIYPIPKGFSINIYFQDFYVENSEDCTKDFLKITDGTEDKIFAWYCGNKTGKTLPVAGDEVEIIFHSDGKTEERGYVLNFTLIPPATASRVPPSFGRPTQDNKDRMIYILSGFAFILLLLLGFIIAFWCYRRAHHKRVKRSARSTREIIPLDKWELLPEQIKYEEELGRGAFGVVYKATLKRRVGIAVFDTEKTLKPEEPCQVVAVKELQDDPSEDQKEEFLQEIEQMKLLGAHQNIVSLVGCCTLQEHKFLVIEYVPFGDLLQWLRRRRRSINRNQGTGGNKEKKCYEDRENFNAEREVSECDQEERDLQDENRTLAIPGGFQVDKRIAISFDLLSQEKDEDTQEEIDRDKQLVEQTLLMMESTPSRDNRDIILDVNLFSENLAEENSNDLLEKENIERMPIPSTSRENGTAVTALMSPENIGDDDDDADDFLDQENIELMPILPTSKADSNAAAILISIQNTDDDDDDGDDDDDDDEDEENSNDLLDQESIELLPMPSTAQGERNASAILLSAENIDDDDDDEEDFLDQKRLEVLSIPSTSQGNRNAAAMFTSLENIDDDDDEEADSCTTQKLFSFAWQIAKGMNHLAEKGFIHRDLAARNILVGSDNRVKVSDFGLMREIYEDVYNGKNTKKLPVKWMAPESINDSIYTIKSDVWSFGILLWEMATMGGVPYPTLTNRELCRLLNTGYRMERPDMCCDEVYELMSECWNEDPSSRPSFSELIDRLEVIMTTNVPYCDLDKHDESRSYYNLPAKADEHSG